VKLVDIAGTEMGNILKTELMNMGIGVRMTLQWILNKVGEWRLN
jgi:hypothetical protein